MLFEGRAGCCILQHTKTLAQPYSRASYAGPFNVGDVGSASRHHVTTSGGDVDDVISIKSAAAAAKVPKRSAKSKEIEVYSLCVTRCSY